MHYLYLALAIAAEVAATTALKSTAGFTRNCTELRTDPLIRFAR